MYWMRIEDFSTVQKLEKYATAFLVALCCYLCVVFFLSIAQDITDVFRNIGSIE